MSDAAQSGEIDHLGQAIEWDRSWLGRHCKGRGQHRCRMIDSSAGTASGEVAANAPRVANRYHFRGNLPAGAIYVGRGTPLGNPFGRDVPDAIGKYRRHLWAKLLAADPDVVGMLSRIRPDQLLVCSCWPRPCHADVIRLAWCWMRDTDQLDDQAQPEKGGPNDALAE